MRLLVLAVLLCLPDGPLRAHDFEYVAEHLPETAMNSRFLTLPAARRAGPGRWTFTLAPGRVSARGGSLGVDGTLLAAGAGYSLGTGWTLRGLAFHDDLSFSGDRDSRFDPRFRSSFPIDVPEDASFTDLRGRMVNQGAGLAVDRESGAWTFTGGAILDRVVLKGYRAEYRMTTGADAGKAGTIDHSATYRFVVPFFTVRYERAVTSRLAAAPRFIFGAPIPKRGWAGRLTGPGFDVSGDTKTAGHGVHVGDGFAGFGLELRDRPTGLALDAGVSIYQALFEKTFHHGISRVLNLSGSWTFGAI